MDACGCCGNIQGLLLVAASRCVAMLLGDLIEFTLAMDATEDDFLNINEESNCRELECTLVYESRGSILAWRTKRAEKTFLKAYLYELNFAMSNIIRYKTFFLV